jgi:shikimate kinase
VSLPPPAGTIHGPGDLAGPLVLIGLRGSGKSTAGRWLAELWSWSFVDLDDRTPALLGCTTPAEALRTRGEPAFRAAESDALRAALAEPRTILALGGGTPTAPGAAELLRAARPRLVYLRGSPAVLRARLATTDLAGRPALTAAGVLDEVDALFAARDPLYTALAAELGAAVDINDATLTDTVFAIDTAATRPLPAR